MAKMEKINFLSETTVNSAEGCARNIWIGTADPQEDITSQGNIDPGSGYYHDVVVGTDRLSMGVTMRPGDNTGVKIWEISTSKLNTNKIVVTGALYFSEWYRSFIYYGSYDSDNYVYRSAIMCDQSTIEEYVKQLDTNEGSVHTYEMTIPESCITIYIQTQAAYADDFIVQQSTGEDGDIYIQYTEEEES
jgi:hypothetical protein